METLKLTTLALLIPIGWHVSEAAAYPQPAEQTEIVGNRGPASHCYTRKRSQSELKEQDNKSLAFSESVLSHIVPTNTAPLPQNRDNQVRICRLDLDLIETD